MHDESDTKISNGSKPKIWDVYKIILWELLNTKTPAIGKCLTTESWSREEASGQHRGLFLVAECEGLSVQDSQRQDADLIQYCYFSDFFPRKRGVVLSYTASSN